MTPDLATIRAVLDLFQVEGSDFYHNEYNDYGCVTMKLFVPGDANRFAGNEVMGRFYEHASRKEVVRGTGRYTLNDALVGEIARMIEERRKK